MQIRSYVVKKYVHKYRFLREEEVIKRIKLNVFDILENCV